MAHLRTRPAVARTFAGRRVRACSPPGAGSLRPSPRDRPSPSRRMASASMTPPASSARIPSIASRQTIRQIEQRTGAQVVVYTQAVEDGRTTEEADADARALMDQWGVGRKGFDDGLVILFDMYPGNEHGQVILVRRPGLPGDVPRQRREAADLRRGHAAAAPRRRPRRRAARGDDEGRCGRDAGARRDAGAGTPARRGPRPPRRPAALRRPRRRPRSGRGCASAGTRSTSTTRRS